MKGGSLNNREPGKHKAIYMAPIKALVQERMNDWAKKFSKLGITCILNIFISNY